MAVCPATASVPRRTSDASLPRPASIRLDLGREDRDERVEVAITRRGEEGVDDLPLLHEIRVGLASAVHAPSRAAGELLSRRLGTVQSRGDVREWHRKDIMQHEGKSLRRRQRVEHHQKCKPNRVGEQRFLLGVDADAHSHHRVGHVKIRELLAPGLSRAQQVQAYPPDDRGQPGLHVLDARRILVANSKPCFLEGIVGFAHGPEHPIRDRTQMRSVLLKTLGQPLTLVHRQSISRPLTG